MLIICILVLVLAACDSGTEKRERMMQPGDAVVMRHNDTALIAEGAEVFKANCARCHGARGQGDPNWRQRGQDGLYPPPPLNGTGHAWHHPQQMLEQMIKYGSPQDAAGNRTGNMPAWGGSLGDRQIRAVIAWFQSLWPDQVYALWYQRQQGR